MAKALRYTPDTSLAESDYSRDTATLVPVQKAISLIEDIRAQCTSLDGGKDLARMLRGMDRATQTFLRENGGVFDIHYQSKSIDADEVRFIYAIHPTVEGLEGMAREQELPFDSSKIINY